MKKTIMLYLLVICVSLAHDELNHKPHNKHATVYRGPDKIELLKTLPPAQASRMFGRLKNKNKNNKQALKEIQQSYQKNPELRAWLEDKVKNTPYSHFNSDTRSYHFGLLGTIKEKWVIKLAGAELVADKVFSDPGMTIDEIGEIISGSDYIWLRENDYLATRTLDFLKIKDAPFKNYPKGGYGKKEIAIWKQWWEENKDRVDEMEFEDEVVEAIPQKEPQNESWKKTSNPRPVDKETTKEQQSAPIVEPKQPESPKSPEPSRSDKQTTKAPQNDPTIESKETNPLLILMSGVLLVTLFIFIGSKLKKS